METLAITEQAARLRKLVFEKNRFLVRLTSRIENLKKELLLIKVNYEAVIGKLYFELDQLDFAIFEMRKLKDLVERGHSPEEAEKILREKGIDARWKDQSQKRQKKAKDGAIRMGAASLLEKEELKSLWRKLAYRFHPDREGGSEEVMKQINKAYSEEDLESLRLIDEEKFSEVSLDVQSQDVVYLSKKLNDLEKIIDRLQQKYKAFKKSEWFLWKTKLSKMEKNTENLFRDVAKTLEVTIAKRKRELARLKNSVVK